MVAANPFGNPFGNLLAAGLAESAGVDPKKAMKDYRRGLRTEKSETLTGILDPLYRPYQLVEQQNFFETARTLTEGRGMESQIWQPEGDPMTGPIAGTTNRYIPTGIGTERTEMERGQAEIRSNIQSLSETNVMGYDLSAVRPTERPAYVSRQIQLDQLRPKVDADRTGVYEQRIAEIEAAPLGRIRAQEQGGLSLSHGGRRVPTDTVQAELDLLDSTWEAERAERDLAQTRADIEAREDQAIQDDRRAREQRMRGRAELGGGPIGVLGRSLIA